MEQFKHRLIRLHQTQPFQGLDPLIGRGAIALLEEMDRIPDTRQERKKLGWDRPIYAIRRDGEILCGHLDNDGQHVALIPHARSSGRRIAFLHHQVKMVERFVGLASHTSSGPSSSSSTEWKAYLRRRSETR